MSNINYFLPVYILYIGTLKIGNIIKNSDYEFKQREYLFTKK